MLSFKVKGKSKDIVSSWFWSNSKYNWIMLMTLSTQTTTRKTCSLTGLQLASDSKSEERAWVSPSTVLSSGLHRSKNLKTAQFDVKTRGKWYKSNVCQVLMSWTKKMIQENKGNTSMHTCLNICSTQDKSTNGSLCTKCLNSSRL